MRARVVLVNLGARFREGNAGRARWEKALPLLLGGELVSLQDLSKRPTNDDVAERLSNRDQRQEQRKANLENACCECERVTDDRHPGEQQ